MADRTLTVKIIGDERDLLRSFRSAERGTQRFTASIGTFVKGALVFEGVRQGIGLLGDAIRAGTAEFTEATKVAAQTNAVLRSTGGLANVTAGDVDKLATSISQLSGIDDELIAAGENLILTFRNVRNEAGKGNAIFDRATKAAVNLSVAGFGAIDSTAKQLGKALNDPVRGMTALGRAGVTFTEKQRTLIKSFVESNRLLDAQRVILREVEKQVGGSARALGETLPGQLNKVREAFRNAFGNLVAVVAQPLATALGAFADFVPKIEAGVARISATVGPALNDLVSAFVERLPELRRIGSSVLDPLREHVVPIVKEMVQVVRNMWANVIAVFSQNEGSLRRILGNLGEVLANVWEVARPTVVFLFEKALPTALRIAIPIIEKVTGVVRVMSQVFVRVVATIIRSLDVFLGGLTKLTDAASHLPFVGDQFKGISDRINGAREGLRGFAGELDDLDGKQVRVSLAIDTTTGRREEGALGRSADTVKKAESEAKKATDSAVEGINAQREGADRIARAATTATTATKTAQTAAEKQREAFDTLLDRLSLRADRAAATRSLTDDLKIARLRERALLDQVKVEGHTVELDRELSQIRQEQADLQQRARQARQFRRLGLTAEGKQRVPGVEALRGRLRTIRDQLKGTMLDTDKTRGELRRIARVLSGQFGSVGQEVRRTILQMFNDISNALKEGDSVGGVAGGEITRGGIRSLQLLTKGLGLTREQIEEMGRRQMGVGRRDRTSAFGFGISVPPVAAAGFGGQQGIIEIHTHVELDGHEVATSVNRVNQKNGRRRAGSRSGRAGGRPHGI